MPSLELSHIYHFNNPDCNSLTILSSGMISDELAYFAAGAGCSVRSLSQNSKSMAANRWRCEASSGIFGKCLKSIWE